MQLSPDDSRLTAFALGELNENDPAEHQQIAAAVAASPELSQAVVDIRATAAALGEAFAAENAQPMSDSAKDTIHAAAAGAARKPRQSRSLIFWPVFGAAAALVLLAFMLAPSITSVLEVRQEASVTADADNVKALKEQVGPQGATQRLDPKDADQRLRMDRHLKLDSTAELDRLTGPVNGPIPAIAPPPVPVAVPVPERQESITVSRSDGLEAASALGTGRIGMERSTVNFMGVQAEADHFSPPSQRVRTQSQVRVNGLVIVESPRPLPQPVDSFRYRTEPWNTDAFDPIDEAAFRSPLIAPLSTFAIDVDTASYAVVRSRLDQGQLPPAAAVRIEELVNYFPYADQPPQVSVEEGGDPFAVHTEMAPAPWAPEHRLLRVNLKGYEVSWDERPPSNLVFLIDVSGSMNRPNRLPLVKEALGLLVERLDGRDRVAIVVYAGASKLTLPSTTANNRETIRHAIDELVASGSTHASDGIQRAYQIARQHFIKDGNNRVILCTDGDFNVGITDRTELGEFVRKQADDGVSLTVLGFGMGNYKDNMLEYLTDKGSGIYAFIDTMGEARKFFLNQIASNLFTIARDVRIQVEFNPAAVKAYRLIGYENRLMKAEDFNDDSKRAGQIGPGHTVTAFYEIVPTGVDFEAPGVDPLRYQSTARPGAEPDGVADELATVKIRYKRPAEEASELIERHVAMDAAESFTAASNDFRFGAAVAAFGMRLRESENIGDFSWQSIRTVARDARGADPEGYRTDFLKLIDQAEKIQTQQTK